MTRQFNYLPLIRKGPLDTIFLNYVGSYLVVQQSSQTISLLGVKRVVQAGGKDQTLSALRNDLSSVFNIRVLTSPYPPSHQ